MDENELQEEETVIYKPEEEDDTSTDDTSEEEDDTSTDDTSEEEDNIDDDSSSEVEDDTTETDTTETDTTETDTTETDTDNDSTVESGVTFSADGLTAILDESLNLNVVDLRTYPAVMNLDAANAPANIEGGLVLIGNTNSNSIMGSSNNANIMTGFTGNNTLTFGSTASDEVYYSGAGNDLVTDFTSGSAGDRVFIETPLIGVVRSGAAVALISATGNALLLNTDSNDGAIQYSDDGLTAHSAQIADQTANTMVYSAESNFFVLGQQGSLIITGEGNNDVRLDGSTGQGFLNVLNLDASTATGNNSLGGDANANVLIGGSGFNVLWGGMDLASDVLIGGVGTNNFFIGKGNGNDIATNASSDDVVSLFDTTLGDIIAAVGNESAVAIAFNTGNVVMVGSTEALSAKFTLSDGSAYQYNHATQSWQTA